MKAELSVFVSRGMSTQVMPAGFFACFPIAPRQKSARGIEQIDGARAEDAGEASRGIVEGLRMLTDLRHQSLGAGFLREGADRALASSRLRRAIPLEDRGHRVQILANLLIGDALGLDGQERDCGADGESEEENRTQEEPRSKPEAARHVVGDGAEDWNRAWGWGSAGFRVGPL